MLRKICRIRCKSISVAPVAVVVDVAVVLRTVDTVVDAVLPENRRPRRLHPDLRRRKY